MSALNLDGATLTVTSLASAARGTGQITADPAGLRRMAQARQLIDAAIESGKPVYGVTRGLGAKVVETLDRDDLAAFSLKTVRGRAHAIGDLHPSEVVRAAMIVRVNTLLKGNSGARLAVAEHLLACLNANITPAVGSIGSIGVADLLPNAVMAAALVGEGRMIDAEGQIGDARDLMARHGIPPLELAARDGLALASHSSMVTASAAMALEEARYALSAVQSAAALSMEAFRANLSVLDDRTLSLKPLPGQLAAAADLQIRLEGSALFDFAQARRLQDPLSIRNIPQIHGTVFSALNHANAIAEVEMNGVSDNPVILPEADEILSSGLYFTAELSIAIDTLCRAFVHLASGLLARTGRHMDANLSGLPAYLTPDGSTSAGLAPVMKVQEALYSELCQAAQPAPIWPSTSGNAVEDCVSGAPTAVKCLERIIALCLRMVSIELVVATQAFDLRQPVPVTGPQVADLLEMIRRLSPRHENDIPLSDDLEQIYQSLTARTLGIATAAA